VSDGISSPPLTVVIPTRDRPELLDGCLSSLRKAIRDTDEVIVCDSASRGGAAVREVAERHGVRYVRTDIPGASRARNLGWQNASNEIVAFMDDDVRVSESWVDTMRSTFKKHPEVTFVTGRILVPENQEQAIRPVATLVHEEPNTFRAGTREWPGHSASLGVRREALELVGGFDERMGPGAVFKSSEEGDLYDRLFAMGRIGRYEPEVLGWHEQWRDHKELLRLDYIYGFGAGTRISKLLKANRVHGIKYALGVYLQWGLWEVWMNLKKGKFFLAFTALVRFFGSVMGLSRSIAVPVRNGHYVPARGALSATGSDPEALWQTAPLRPGGTEGDRDRPEDVRKKPTQPLLRVGVDLTPGAAAITGIARYSQMLWEELEQRTDVAPRAFMGGRVERMESASILRLHMPIRALHALWRLGRPRAETIFGDVEVIHCIDMLPPPTHLPLVVTWHDTFRLPGPEYHDPRNLELRKQRLAALDKASVVLTYCEATAQELVEATGYPRDRIVLSPPGYDLRQDEDSPPPVEGPFILAAGALTPRKGFDVLARAMRELGDKAPPLVIAGPDGFRADDVRRQIFDAVSPERCILLGERYGSMTSLYKQAAIVCHPSLAEGFGYVCLEAMGAGAPVVAADIPSIREMGEGAVSLVPAGDAEAMAHAISALLEDDEERARLSKLGIEKARAYTWAHTADQTVIAYNMAAGR
jgi:glycosyltransferase involved in cell wall biosynthesis